MKKVYHLVVIATAALITFGGCNEDKDEAAMLTVSPVDAVEFAADGTTTSAVTFTVTTNQSEWDATSNQTWLTVKKSATSFTLSAEAHTSTTAPEAATVTVTAGTAQAITINVTQAAYVPGAPELQSIAVTAPPAKTNYNVGDVIDLAGLVVTGTYNIGEPQALTVTDADVTYDFSTAGAKTVTITIGGKTTTFDVVVDEIISPTFISALSAEGQYAHTIIADGAWTASSSESWCDLSHASGSGNATLTIHVAAHTEKTPRSATITITGAGEPYSITVAQMPVFVIDRNLSWTEADGTPHTTIPADKNQWNNGEVLEYKKATKGAGVNLVIIGDAFNQMELAVGSVYETSSKELADMFLRMPVVRDYQEYFNIYILMWNFNKSGLFNEYPDGSFENLLGGKAYTVFNPRIDAMPQLADKDKGQNTTVIYNANGWAGGYMTTQTYNYASYQFSIAESNPVYWMIHECTGHAFASLGDEYLAPEDITEWEVTDWTPPLITPEVKPIEWNWAQNCRVAPWSENAWDAMIARPGNAGYAANIDGYRQIDNTHWAEPAYIWKNQTASNYMRVNPSISSDPWLRFLVYKRIMELAQEPYSVANFLENDNKQGYTKVDDWYAFLGLTGWQHSFPVHNHEQPSPYALWDK